VDSTSYYISYIAKYKVINKWVVILILVNGIFAIRRLKDINIRDFYIYNRDELDFNDFKDSYKRV
jgi:hypothetical protein